MMHPNPRTKYESQNPYTEAFEQTPVSISQSMKAQPLLSANMRSLPGSLN